MGVGKRFSTLDDEPELFDSCGVRPSGFRLRRAAERSGVLDQDPADFLDHLRVLKADVVCPDHDL
jgi:hypothetical protein